MGKLLIFRDLSEPDEVPRDESGTTVPLSVYHNFIPFVLPFLLISFFFLRLFFPEESLFMIPDFGESDVLHLNLPFKHILSESLKKGEWPIWTPNLMGGFPLLAEGQIGTFYLPNLLLFRFLPTITAYNLNLVIAFILLYLGTFLFLRSLNFSKIPSSIGGIIFTFSGFLSVHLNHFNLIQAASLLPFIFLSFNLLWRKPSFGYTILTAFLLSQQIFTGHFYIVFITLVGIFLFWIGLFLCHPKPSKEWNFLILLVLSLIWAFFLSSIQLFPTIELWQSSGRKSGLDFDTVTAYPYPFKHLITFIWPYFFGDPGKGTYPPFSPEWGIFWENTAYIGIIPLILALTSIFFSRDKIVKINWLILITSFLLVFGKYSPLYFIFSFPPFNLFRVPSKFLLLTTFSLSLLSTLTLEKLISWAATKGKSHMHAIASICYIGIIFLLVIADEYRFSYNYPPVSPAKLWTEMPQTAKFLEGKEGRIISIGGPHIWNSIFLKKGWQEIKPYEYLRISLHPNYNTLFSLPNISINTGGLMPRRTALFKGLLENMEIDQEKNIATISSLSKNMLSLGNVRSLVSPYKINDPQFLQTFQIEPPKGSPLPTFYVYQNKYARQRSYIAFTSQKVETLEDIYGQLLDDDFLSRETIFIEDNKYYLKRKGDPSAQVGQVVEKDTKIVLQTNSKEDGLLVLSDTNYPGWKAFLDGEGVPITVVNLVQRAIFLPKGSHHVLFVFKSETFELGKRVTIITALIILLILFLSRVFSPQKAFRKK